MKTLEQMSEPLFGALIEIRWGTPSAQDIKREAENDNPHLRSLTVSAKAETPKIFLLVCD